jgi:hypothetical protein
MRFAKQGPFWLTLIPAQEGDEESPRGFRVKFAPATRSMKRRAARASQSVLGGRIDFTDRERVLSDEELDLLVDAGEMSSAAMIRMGILEQPEPEWDGAFDEAGKPLPVTEENVDIILANEEVFEAADRLYVRPIALAEMQRAQEKNGSAPSPNGTGGARIAARPIAQTARKRAPSARTRSTPSKPRKAKGSGGS